MLIGLNKENKTVNIVFSKKEESYVCPLCKEEMVRNYGVQRQYFSHKSGKGEECELKMKKYFNTKATLNEENLNYLEEEYFNKKFDDIKTEMSEYISEEGYPLTMEQLKIIKSNKDRIKISATAGSSKTTTLYYYSKERPTKNILYLVYNAAMKKEAEHTFGKLSHVTIKTIHGLAYGYVGWKYRDKLTFNYSAVDVINDLNLKWDGEQELAFKVYYLLNEFMLSKENNIDDVEVFLDDEDREKIIRLAKKLWALKEDVTRKDIKIEHDFYLKLFQLQKMSLKHKYDIVMLDEAQDSNLLTFDLIINLDINGVVMVGDPHQQMYAWRNAQNILKLFEAEEYTLNTSFRVSQNIANISNSLIKDAFSEDLNMKGFNSNQKIVLKLNKNDKYTFISRTNAALFDKAIDIMESDKKIFFEGGFESYKFNNIRDAYYFYLGKPTNNPMFKKFKSYSKMKEYAEKIKDLELLSIIRALVKYGSAIPSLVEKIRKNSVTDKKKSDYILTTAHKSKGETYENVEIASDYLPLSDFYSRLYIQNRMNNVARAKFIKDNEEECHILYVAITRAKNKIVLNSDIMSYLLLKDSHDKLLNGIVDIDIDTVKNIPVSHCEIEEVLKEDEDFPEKKIIDFSKGNTIKNNRTRTTQGTKKKVQTKAKVNTRTKTKAQSKAKAKAKTKSNNNFKSKKTKIS